MNLFSICAHNDPAIKRQFDDLISSISSSEKDTVITFSERVMNEGQIGINMRPITLLDFLASHRYLNIYQFTELILSRSTKSRDEILMDKLGSYYEKRIAFDHFFDRGEDFNYGTLSIGGIGAKRYGEYCVVLDREKIKGVGELGYLDADSLRTYICESVVEKDRQTAESVEFSYHGKPTD